MQTETETVAEYNIKMKHSTQAMFLARNFENIVPDNVVILWDDTKDNNNLVIACLDEHLKHYPPAQNNKVFVDGVACEVTYARKAFSYMADDIHESLKEDDMDAAVFQSDIIYETITLLSVFISVEDYLVKFTNKGEN